MAQNKEDEEVEIDLLELAKKLWDNKKFILKSSVIGVIVGIIIAFSIPKEYTATVILTSGSGKSAVGNMGALASMAGINLGGAIKDDVFSPELYPTVLSSTPFVRGLLNIHVSDPNQGINTTLYSYLKDEQKSAWWSYILKAPGIVLGLFKSDSSSSDSTIDNKYFISKEEMGIIAALTKTYSIDTDTKIGVTTLAITTQSPTISAFLADTLTSYLQTYIIEQRTKKAKTDLTNSEKLYEQAKTDYYTTQQHLASFVDANMNVISAKYQINQEKLQNEANLANSVYNQMAQQVQIHKIKIQDVTPAFTIIQPAVEPLFPEKPKKKIIVLGFIFLSFIVSGCWTLRDDLKQMIIRK